MAPGGVIADTNWTDNPTYTYISPRLGFSFPVTDRAVFHAQFGKYVQAPSLQQTWTHRSYTGWLDYLYGGVYFAPIHNPNLKPSKTTSYEFGFQMQFGANASLDITAFYKDTRDLATYRAFIPLITDYRAPTYFANGDFGTIKGFTATFNLRRTSRIQAQLNYTYSHAEGTGSSYGEHADIAWQEEDPHYPRIISPLTYDQRHKGTVVIDARTQPDDGPEFLGGHPLGNIGLNLKFDFHSGSPFTRIGISDTYSQVYGYNAPPPVEPYHSSTLPWFYQLDAKLDKTFTIGPVKLNVYLWAINLLDMKTITNGFRQTGRPDTDGWLATNAGKDKLRAMGEYADDYENWYLARITNCGTFGWQAPRQIRFGVKFEI
jgi:outer membrane receptor protein involved in Fe transport